MKKNLGFEYDIYQWICEAYEVNLVAFLTCMLYE
jgi:hypothetical protein